MKKKKDEIKDFDYIPDLSPELIKKTENRLEVFEYYLTLTPEIKKLIEDEINKKLINEMEFSRLENDKMQVVRQIKLQDDYVLKIKNNK
jgi:methyltransferase-like protein